MLDDFKISDEAVEAVAKAFMHPLLQWDLLEDGERDRLRRTGHAAIEAFLGAEGFEVEQNEGHVSANPDSDTIPIYRLVSPWKPENA